MKNIYRALNYEMIQTGGACHGFSPINNWITNYLWVAPNPCHPPFDAFHNSKYCMRYFRSLRPNPSYNKSNDNPSVDFELPTHTIELMHKLILSFDLRERELFSQIIINALCDNAQIPRCKITVKDVAQQHTKRNGRLRGKTLAFYQVASEEIVLFNKTAIQKKVLAGKTFLRTLIHEFMHHYDKHFLKIRSLHTAGFYKRVGEVYGRVSGGK